MKAYRYISSQDRIIISPNVLVAGNFFQRFSGLLFRRALKDDEVLLLTGCRSIHTIGMRYSIDIAFLDIQGQIIAVFETLPPCRLTPYFPEAFSVMESRAGFLKKNSLGPGDRVIFE